MATIIDSAICIRRWDFSETSQTVSLLTREHGVIRGLAKGAKRPRSAYSGGIDVLTRGQASLIVKGGTELAAITAWHLEEMYRAARTRLDVNRAALYMADLVHHMLTGHDPHPAVFDEFDAALLALDHPSSPGGVPAVLLRFQWMLLRESGYPPQFELEGDDDRSRALGFDPNLGRVVRDPGTGSGETSGAVWRVRRETIQLLAHLAAGSTPAPAPAAAVFDRANRLLAAYLRHLIGQEPATLRWAFSDPP